MRSMIMALVSGALLLSGSAALADEDEDSPFAREGGYLGLSAQVTFGIFREDDLVMQNLGADVSDGYGLALRGGWRHSPHLATELLMGVVIDRDYRVKDFTVPSTTDTETREITGTYNVKVPFLTDRIQPYAVAGMGIYYLKRANTTKDDMVSFLIRGGLGLDVYVTENWVVNAEGIYMYPTSKGIVAPNTSKVRLDYVALNVGFSYRF